MKPEREKLVRLRGEVDAALAARAAPALAQRIEAATFHLPPGFAGALASEWARASGELFGMLIDRFAAAARPTIEMLTPPAAVVVNADLTGVVAALGRIAAGLEAVAKTGPPRVVNEFAPVVTVTPEIRVEIERLVVDVLARMPTRRTEIVGPEGERSVAVSTDVGAR